MLNTELSIRKCFSLNSLAMRRYSGYSSDHREDWIHGLRDQDISCEQLEKVRMRSRRDLPVLSVVRACQQATFTR